MMAMMQQRLPLTEERAEGRRRTQGGVCTSEVVLSAHESLSSVKGIPVDSPALRNLHELNRRAETSWKDKLVLETSLSRSLVSFQANKGRAVYRWFKYKEAFSAGLVEYFLNRYRITKGNLLDPFAGSGTALFAAGAFGMRPEGIGLLPIGQTVIATKRLTDREIRSKDKEGR
ncbi:MAG: hypothetical protein A3H28_11260 [Acidobacteria bacterium RIFCSPLOWO2_02_FULL_61_28]|nr:MAG: hypothetical protein A3H28_11260 [Acidobacteria bacterium RIFCSPLOWO2_02_FULL_61_28]